MKVLLDESLPRRLKQQLPGHEVATVPERNWSGKENGELLSLAKDEFDVFLTADQNIEYQQNLGRAEIAVVVLAAPTNRLEDLKPLMGQVLRVLQRIRRGELVRVEGGL